MLPGTKWSGWLNKLTSIAPGDRGRLSLSMTPLEIEGLYCAIYRPFVILQHGQCKHEGSGLSIMWTPWCHLLANCDTPLHRLCEHVRSPVYSGSSFFNREAEGSGLSIMRLVGLGGVGWRVGVKGLTG